MLMSVVDYFSLTENHRESTVLPTEDLRAGMTVAQGNCTGLNAFFRKLCSEESVKVHND